MSDIVDKVRELSRIKADIAKLNDRRKELEAYFLERGGDDVVDTKFKSTVYADPDSQAAVTYTEAQALTIVYPHYLKETLGAMFPDIFEEAVKTEVKPKNKDIRLAKNVVNHRIKSTARTAIRTADKNTLM